MNLLLSLQDRLALKIIGSCFMTHRSSFSQLLVLLLLSCSLLIPTGVGAEETPAAKVDDASILEFNSAPVVVDGRVLFTVHGISARPAERRAQAISERIVAVAANPNFTTTSLRIDDQPNAHVLMAGNKLLMGVSDADARFEGVDRLQLAEGVRERVSKAIDSWRLDRAPATLQRHALFACGATLILVLALWGGARLSRLLRRFLELRLQQGLIRDTPQFKGHGFWGRTKSTCCNCA
jgi:hypothetical protein